MNKYFYEIDGEQFTFQSLSDKDEPQWIAEEAAEDYHSNHDGWEDRWPVEIKLQDAATFEYLGKFKVEREHIPQFYASKIKE